MTDARSDAATLARRWLDARLEAPCGHRAERAFANFCLDCVTSLAEQAYAAGTVAHQPDTCYTLGYREGYLAGVTEHVEHSRCRRCYDAGKLDASHVG